MLSHCVLTEARPQLQSRHPAQLSNPYVSGCRKNIERISSPLEIQMYIQWFLRDFWFTIHSLTLHLSQFRPSTFGWHWQDPKSRSHDTEPHWSHVQAKTTKKNYVLTCKKNSTVFTCTSVGHRMGTLAVFEGYCVSMVPVFTIGTSGSHGVVETLKTLPSGQAARLGVRHINVTRTLARATYFSFLSWVSIVTRGTPEG